MSKFKLEVDDIRKCRCGCGFYHIIQVSENAVRCFHNQYTLKPETFDKLEFWKRTKYVGKSKANIKDLFEVAK